MELGPAVSPGPSRSFKEELLCAVCYDPFRDAVTLRCGHNFCRGCVTRCWEVQVTPTCPVCKDRAALADLRTNHTLNNLVEKLLREESEGARWAGHRSARLCRLHRGQFSLFCLDDKELLCCSCQADSRHQGHRVQPVKDTAHDFRAKCRNMEHALREKAKAFWAVRRSYEAIAKHNQKHKSRKRRLFCTMEPEPVQPGMLIDVCKYLDSLQYRVWRKMVTSVESVPFSFDPNTAAGWLSVSNDLTSVTNHGYRVQVENPERFSSAPCLLGSRVFSQGSHTWEVDLGGLPSWRVGVMRLQQDAGAEGHSHSCYHDTRSGFWYVCRTQGVEGDHCVTSDPATSALVPAIPRRLRVELECEEGELSFYDAESHCHLYTFHARFGEVRPYFYLGGMRGDGPAEPLRICPLRITVKEELDG
ncbi:E3 ubiquitin-protein ligase TRIM35 isoform X2 [Herpailurus yagouaroundi]|uniref:E3 ubiquitin-protein ligase TRIM35 isoform X2 n=1 Tax=Herpailurus yagouaroundi TaxID=1608482 RepID=UPI001AD7A7AE|nr:E3 ubiquitin-protein ligase TRIM35 isoform X2 [Puma yagouaroundi]